jgi:hypothetical protein
LTQSIKIDKQSPELPEYEGTIWIDSDIECSLADVIHLIELKKDIVGLPYTIRGDKSKYNAGYIKDGDFIHLPTSETGLKKVDGQGMGCRYISMGVFKKMTPFWFWPSTLEHNGKIQTLVEDWAFDLKARKLGFNVYCHFNRPVGHNTGEPQMPNAQEPNPTPAAKSYSLTEVGRVATKISMGLQGNINTLTKTIIDLCEEMEKKNALISQLSDDLKNALKSKTPLPKAPLKKKK